jgi:hypothetical protein
MAKLCPYCGVPLSEPYDGDKRSCVVCGREFYEKDGELVLSVMKKAAGLKKRLRAAEEAYPEAMKILKNLDREENRRILAETLNEVGYGNIRPGDFMGAKLVIPREKDEYMRIYGSRAYPLIIRISRNKYSEVKEKFRGDPNWILDGVNIKVRRWPFSALGGIRISFSGRPTTEEHEILHGTFGIYRGTAGRHAPDEAAESLLLDEINSFRSEAMMEFGHEVERGDYEGFGKYWNDVIKRHLIGRYIPDAVSRVGGVDKDALENVLRGHIERIIPIIVRLQTDYDGSVLTRILMKSRDLSDVEAWSKRKDTLKQWHERAVRTRENGVRKYIAGMSRSYRSTPGMGTSIRSRVLQMVSEYWRFIGNPKDEAAKNRYAEKLIIEGTKHGKAGSEEKEFLEKLKGGFEAESREEVERDKEVIERLERGFERARRGETRIEKEFIKKLKKELEESR